MSQVIIKVTQPQSRMTATTPAPQAGWPSKAGEAVRGAVSTAGMAN
ncbi:MAG: hypothetical protein JXM69_05035 [Anaerolineae bacterium]|nr:hypothetical protein [Anaerolineae bacterium]